MTKRHFSFIIALMGITLTGILIAQFYWVRNAYEVSEREFQQRVNMAMNDVVQELKTDEIKILVDDRIRQEVILTDSVQFQSKIFVTSSNEQVEFKQLDSSDTSWTYEEVIWMDDEHDFLDSESIYSSPKNAQSNRKEVTIKTVQRADSTYSDTLITGIEESEIENIFLEILHDYSSVDDRVETRLEAVNLDSLSSSKLLNHGIEDPFYFAVTDNDGASLLSDFSSQNYVNVQGQVFSKLLFQNDIVKRGNLLLFNFPSNSSYVFGKMRKVVILGLLLTSMMLLTFYFTLRTILKQKKVSVMKNDFINNMTHEFKTPIATIKLALDSIEHVKIGSDSAHLDKFTEIIRKENERLHTQVERVLQIAQFKNSTELMHFHIVELNELVIKSLDQIKLLLEDKGGEIELNLTEDSTFIKADEDLLIRMIVNLLDNSIKYSQSPPVISINTRVETGRVKLSMEDKGIGMKKETVERIFENFFREETGNIHQTKGFGIGMSYVKMIIEKHNGNIAIESEVGVGTRVEITIPKSHE